MSSARRRVWGPHTSVGASNEILLNAEALNRYLRRDLRRYPFSVISFIDSCVRGAAVFSPEYYSFLLFADRRNFPFEQ